MQGKNPTHCRITGSSGGPYRVQGIELGLTTTRTISLALLDISCVYCVLYSPSTLPISTDMPKIMSNSVAKKLLKY